ncbi:mitochondrial glycine amidinotransferase [Diplogelasinospora grovesii]|uniref:Glycine amidinotransferase, mitochondrial n=1 Tax=Diplogelasinospora grovesii TaxID=303347 RepID=A0AAN6N567_9PEZI|nr:mitochondrial glycine amidinotransferase [Diplogelasinospora grovesii]
MAAANMPLVAADDEWSPLKSVIVGRAENSAFPSEAAHMIEATMPEEHHANFRSHNPFPADIVAKAQLELDNFAALLEREGIKVYRPRKVDWVKVGGYTGAMPRDCLMTVGNTLIEAPFAWKCRRHEVQLGYSDILDQLASGDSSSAPVRICRAPLIIGQDTLYDGLLKKPEANGHSRHANGGQKWAINNSRPAFDTADFMRFGKTIIGQLSNVTNHKGFQYLQAMVPDGYRVELLETTDEHAMHIDATILPLKKGVLVYNPDRVTEEELRKHNVFRDWELVAYPFVPQKRSADCPPMYMCSPWLVLNALSLDEKRIMVEEKDTQFADWVREKFGMEPIMIPFQHVNSLGGSFHCATVDLVRES